MGRKNYKSFINKQKNNIDNFIPKGKPEDLDRKIEDLHLSKRCFDALKAGGILTLRQLCSISESKMFRIQKIGKKECIEIKEKLKMFQLTLRPEEILKAPKSDSKADSNQEKAQSSQQNNQLLKQKYNFSIFDDTRLVEFVAGPRQREIFKWEDESQEKRDLNKFCRNGKWGYKDVKGRVVIQPIYDEAFQFREDLACVEKAGKLGYIDKNGNVVIDFQYDSASSFFEGLACVSNEKCAWFIDQQGNKFLDKDFEKVSPFSKGKALIKSENKWGFLSKDGSIYWR